MPDTLDATSSTAVQSPVAVTGEEWVHLVAAFNAYEDTMSLWVCEIGTPQEPAPGAPVNTEVSRTALPWEAAGAFRVGQATVGGDLAEAWPGSIDNIRVFSGQVVSEAKIRRMCQGAEATDFTTGDTALDPTTIVGG